MPRDWLVASRIHTVSFPKRAPPTRRRRHPRRCRATLRRRRLVSISVALTRLLARLVTRFARAASSANRPQPRRPDAVCDQPRQLDASVAHRGGEKSRDVDFRPVSATMQQLCNADNDRELLFEVYDYHAHSKHDLIGACRTTFSAIRDGQRVFQLVNEDEMLKARAKKKTYTNSGMLELLSYKLSRRAVVYGVRTWRLRDLATRRHRLHVEQRTAVASAVAAPAGGRRNERVRACHRLCVQRARAIRHRQHHSGVWLWRRDRQASSATASRCAATASRASASLVCWRRTAMRCRASHSRARRCSLTSFAPPPLRRSPRPSRSRRTPCCCCSPTACSTKISSRRSRRWSRRRGAAISIVIVGVGRADFTDMDRIDSDSQLIVAPRSGRKAVRDAVQFVPYRDYKQHPQLLAREVLYELPRQFLEYCHLSRWQPKPPQLIVDGDDAGFIFSECRRGVSAGRGCADADASDCADADFVVSSDDNRKCRADSIVWQRND
jgi:hypothetical protein